MPSPIQAIRSHWPAAYDRYHRPRSPRPAKAAAPVAGPSLTSSLTPYAPPLDARRARHLLRRTRFGASVEPVNALVGQTAADIVNALVDEAVARPMPDPPDWANAYLPPDDAPENVREAYIQNTFAWNSAYVRTWAQLLYEGGLREKMTLFWHNHFVTERETYFFAPMAYQYLTALRTYALGNFRVFVSEIGKVPAMLVYLDGRLNVKEEPNENYARELLELFTMGHYDRHGAPNYTQHDIVELSRALTGWWVDYSDFTPHFAPDRHDGATKQIFGVTDYFDYRRVVPHLFAERGPQIAHFICRKLYTAFVHDAVDEDFVAALADVFVAEGFEIAPVLRALLMSERFFDEQVIGAKIKSPIDFTIGMLHETGVRDLEPHAFSVAYERSRDLGLRLLQPPNVAGWVGYHDWINTTTLPTRWDDAVDFLHQGLTGYLINMLPLAEQLGDPADPLLVFRLPLALAEHFMAVPADRLSYEAPAEAFAGDLVTHPLPAEIQDAPPHVRDLAKLFLAGMPWYEWHLYRPGGFWQILGYVQMLTSLPEYQLT